MHATFPEGHAGRTHDHSPQSPVWFRARTGSLRPYFAPQPLCQIWQGLPLVPDDLRMVAAGTAASTVVISNSSRRGRALSACFQGRGGACFTWLMMARAQQA